MAHSIPESNALIIRTPLGAVLHTGDWKIDATPVLGLPTDETSCARSATRAACALVGDFDQCGARGPLALGSRCGEDHRRTDREPRAAASR